jgi:hypothetical protein
MPRVATSSLCDKHGAPGEAFVCRHIAESLLTGVAVGFHWPASSTQPYPDAWCTTCEQARVAAGGAWTPEVEAMLEVKLLCGQCYLDAKSIWQTATDTL